MDFNILLGGKDSAVNYFSWCVVAAHGVDRDAYLFVAARRTRIYHFIHTTRRLALDKPLRCGSLLGSLRFIYVYCVSAAFLTGDKRIAPVGRPSAIIKENALSMPQPKKKTSHQKQQSRRAHWKAPAITLTTCSNCAQPVRPHQVCSSCGYYRGRPAYRRDSLVAG